jgi:hypothetical protein
MSSTSNNTGANSESRPKMLPRADSKDAKKADARKTKNLELISLGEFLKESENEGGDGTDGASDTGTAGKSGVGSGDDDKKRDDVK